MIEKLEIHHLRTLDALYKFEKISSAAESLNVSQQAISLQLKKISEILCDRLFVRTGHGVTPTPYAKLIEPHVHKVLINLSEIPLPASITPSKISRTLTISATDYTQQFIVGELISELKDSAPKVRVIIQNIEVVELTKKMHQGKIDLALTSNGYTPEGLVCKSLFTEKYTCVTANNKIKFDNDYPLEHLVEHDFVITNPGVGSLRGSADTWFEQQGIHRNIAVSSPSFHITQEYLKQTDMVGFLPSRFLPCEGLFEIPLKKYPPGFEIVAAYHPSIKNDPLMTWLLDRVISRFSE